MKTKTLIILFIISSIIFSPVISLSDDTRVGEMFETADDIITAIRDGNTADYEQCLYLEILYDEDGLNTIPQNAFSFFPNVQELTIDTGVTCEDYSSIKDLRNLTVLNLCDADLVNIDFLNSLTNLQILGLSGNSIRNGNPIASLRDLEFLDVSENELSDISFVSELINLKVLYIEGNKGISDITPLSTLEKLEALSLSNTAVKDIESLCTLKKLEELSVAGNGIDNLDPISALENLIWLDVRNNNIFDVSSLSKLKKLEYLYLAGNPIENLQTLKELPLISLDGIMELAP